MPDPPALGKRLVHMTEQVVARLPPADVVEDRRTTDLEPASDGVVRQLRYGGRDVREEDVDRPEFVELASKVLR